MVQGCSTTNTRFIALFKGRHIAGFATVDADDFDELNRHRWRLSRVEGRRRYAVRSRPGSRGTVRMHRLLCESAYDVDHINGDSLDNRRSNLRPATRAQNMCNRGRTRVNSSGFKGVYRSGRDRWNARIKADQKSHNLGNYDTPEEAHAAYCEAAKRLHGEFARFA